MSEQITVIVQRPVRITNVTPRTTATRVQRTLEDTTLVREQVGTTEQDTIAVTQRTAQTTTVGLPGIQGPPGFTGPLSSTDQLPEGQANLYFTSLRADQRVQAVLQAAVASGSADGAQLVYAPVIGALGAQNTDKGSTAVTQHTNASDPHPQYLDASETIDGGNF